MKSTKRHCFTLILALIGFNSLASQVFLESFWLNTIPSSSCSIWVSGNESAPAPGSTNDAPHSSNGFYLLESAVGQITAQTCAYPGAITDLAANADSARTNASPYRYTSGVFGTVSNPVVVLNLVFPGGFNPSTGQVYGPGVVSTYTSSLLDQAEYALRALLRIDPANTNAAQELVLLVEDRSFPFEFTGSETVTYAAKARLLGQNAALKQMPAMGLAASYFQQACDTFSAFLNNPYDAALVEGNNILLSSAVSNQVNQVLDDYIRNLANYAQAKFVYFYLTNLSNFRDPSQGQLPSQALLQQIDEAVTDIQLRLLLTSPFQQLPVYTFSELGRVRSYLRELVRLHDSIVQGRISFIATTATADTTLEQYGEYNSWYVPFFSGLPPTATANNNFLTALNLAKHFTSDSGGAKDLESTEMAQINQVLQGQYSYATDQENLRAQYLSQLQSLCGYFYDSLSQPFPDVLTAGFRPDVRVIIAGTNNIQLVQSGAIQQQWQALQQAESSYQLAIQNLTNTFAEMLQKQLVASAIASNYQRLAALILTNGQTLAGLDIQGGEVRAQLDQEVAELKAEEAETEAETSGMFGAMGSIIDIYRSGGTSGFASLGNSMATIANGYESAATELQIGQVQAQADRQLAAIQAQEDQLKAAESAAMQYVNSDNTMLQLSLDLNTLRLQAKSQAIQVDLAAQQIDQERTKLSTLLGQVAYLLRQWSRSANLLAQNPQLSQELIIQRDATIQHAEDAFVLAQQWSFLAAQAFYYADNCPDALGSAFVQKVLVAQNGGDLQAVLNNMESAYNVIASSGCQNSYQTRFVRFSLRNDLFQANQTSGQGTNTQYFIYEPILTNGMVFTNAAASDAAWVAFLKGNVITNQYAQRVLKLDFATSLAWQHITGGAQRNPLFKCSDFGAIISPTPYLNSAGVQVSITTKGPITFPLGANQGFQAVLSQLGTSSLRSLGFACPSTTFRYFNFGFFPVSFTAAANSLDAFPGTAVFAARSPANDHWQFSINESDDGGNGNNAAILDHLDQVNDIELRFAVFSYTDPCAQTICNQSP